MIKALETHSGLSTLIVAKSKYEVRINFNVVTMNDCMFARTGYIKIFWSIIKFISVDVVNMLSFFQESFQIFFSHKNRQLHSSCFGIRVFGKIDKIVTSLYGDFASENRMFFSDLTTGMTRVRTIFARLTRDLKHFFPTMPAINRLSFLFRLPFAFSRAIASLPLFPMGRKDSDISLAHQTFFNHYGLIIT